VQHPPELACTETVRESKIHFTLKPLAFSSIPYKNTRCTHVNDKLLVVSAHSHALHIRPAWQATSSRGVCRWRQCSARIVTELFWTLHTTFGRHILSGCMTQSAPCQNLALHSVFLHTCGPQPILHCCCNPHTFTVGLRLISLFSLG
jgi:hypothetical protein